MLWGWCRLLVAQKVPHRLSGTAAPSPVPTDLATLIQRRQSRLAVNLTPSELAMLDSVAAQASSTRSNLARALLLNSIKQLQAA